MNLEDMVDRACIIAYQEGFARPGDRIAITAGIPLGTPGRDQHAAHRVRAAGRRRLVVGSRTSSFDKLRMRSSVLSVDLMVSLSNHEVVSPMD